jgi:hypothetical protein
MFYYESRKRELKTKLTYENRCDERLETDFVRKTPKNEGIRTFAQFAIALRKPMKKEWKKTKS